MTKFSVSAGLIVALATAAVLGGGATTTASANNNWKKYTWGRSLDSLSSAQPSAAIPTVKNVSQNFLRTGSSTAKADAGATSSAICDGCNGEATTVQVVYFDGKRGTAAADNTASAWSTCADCSASAVSVQIVVSPYRQSINVNNRALAVNADCVSCSTSAAALQFVLSGGKRRDLSAAAKDLVSQIKAELAGRLETAAKTADPGMARMAAEATVTEVANRIEQIIVADIGAGSVDRSVDVKLG